MYSTVRGFTHVGRVREGNEDSFLVDADLKLALVADGMGGHACGEVASQLCAEKFREAVVENHATLEAYASRNGTVSATQVEELLEQAMLRACRAVFDAAQEDATKRGMGTTCTALMLLGDHAFVSHVGDSRIYLVRDGNSVQLTRDHSLLNHLVDQGRITVTQATDAAFAGYRNALARAVGVCPEVEVDTFVLEALPDDVYVLGSDGLTAYIQDGDLASMTTDHDGALAERLVAMANERGGHDNITAVTVELATEESQAERHAARAAEFAAKVEAFRRVPMFRELTYSHLLHVLSLASAATLPSEKVVVREGEAGDSLFVILSGSVRVNRGETLVAELGAGDHFGELSLLDDAPRSATVTVTSEARLLRLQRSDLTAIMTRTPQLGLRLLWSLAGVVAARLRATTDELVDLQADTVPAV